MMGASGKMGRDIMRGIIDETDIEIAGAVDLVNDGMDISDLIGGEPRYCCRE